MFGRWLHLLTQSTLFCISLVWLLANTTSLLEHTWSCLSQNWLALRSLSISPVLWDLTLILETQLEWPLVTRMNTLELMIMEMWTPLLNKPLMDNLIKSVKVTTLNLWLLNRTSIKPCPSLITFKFNKISTLLLSMAKTKKTLPPPTLITTPTRTSSELRDHI